MGMIGPAREREAIWARSAPGTAGSQAAGRVRFRRADPAAISQRWRGDGFASRLEDFCGILDLERLNSLQKRRWNEEESDKVQNLDTVSLAACARGIDGLRQGGNTYARSDCDQATADRYTNCGDSGTDGHCRANSDRRGIGGTDGSI